MMWLLLFGLTAAVILLPMVPAWMEWRRPSDVVPLFIDNDDAQDPPFLARSFESRLGTALAMGKTHLGRSPIMTFPPCGAWPLNDSEHEAAISQRVWNVVGDAELPAGISFLAEVAAQSSLQSAAGGIYRALWAGLRLQLAPRSVVLRWAHAPQVTVGAGCQLAGRVTADNRIDIAAQTTFTLLHAPMVCFVVPQCARVAPAMDMPLTLRSGLPPPVVWNEVACRGVCNESLKVGRHNAWRGDLIVAGDLWLGESCTVDGSLKSAGLLTLEARCKVSGSIVSVGLIQMAADCMAGGSVISETAIVLGPGCIIGTPERPCTVAAPRIEVASGVIVHGTLWAGEHGRCLSADVATSPPTLFPTLRAAVSAQKATA